MREIIESMGLTVSEIIGAAIVFAALVGAVVVFKQYGDAIISLFVSS